MFHFLKGSDSAKQIMTEIMTLLKSINATTLDSHGGGTDIEPWMEAGVPGASLRNDNNRYFYFHHSNGKYYNGYITKQYYLNVLIKQAKYCK